MFEDKISKEEVRARMALPYEIKVRMTENRLREFIGYYGQDGVAVSISGGLDSTAAIHFIHARYPRVEAVSVLGIECRDNIKMVMKIRDGWGVKVNIAAPKMTQEAVIKEFGYPVVTKIRYLGKREKCFKPLYACKFQSVFIGNGAAGV